MNLCKVVSTNHLVDVLFLDSLVIINTMRQTVAWVTINMNIYALYNQQNTCMCRRYNESKAKTKLTYHFICFFFTISLVLTKAAFIWSNTGKKKIILRNITIYNSHFLIIIYYYFLLFISVRAKLNFQQCSVSHDPSEIIHTDLELKKTLLSLSITVARLNMLMLFPFFSSKNSVDLK